MSLPSTQVRNEKAAFQKLPSSRENLKTLAFRFSKLDTVVLHVGAWAWGRHPEHYPAKKLNVTETDGLMTPKGKKRIEWVIIHCVGNYGLLTFVLILQAEFNWSLLPGFQLL